MIKSIENAVQRVKDSYPSIYSKDDVVNLLYELMSDLDTDIDEIVKFDREQQSNNSVSDEMLKKLEDDIYDEMVYSNIHLIDDYDLEMNYREVDLTDVTYNKRAVRELVSKVVSDVFGKEEVETE